MTSSRRRLRSAPPLAALCGALLLSTQLGCQTTQKESVPMHMTTAPQLVEVAAWMTGSFSSAAQAEAYPDGFYDIRLEMVPIWTSRDDGPWLYVEQAAAGNLDSPYRQRVYHLVEVEGVVRSDVYELPGDALVFAGAWARPASLDVLRPQDLAERTGCSIYLHPADGGFAGSTRGDGCSSSLGGASYATSEVFVGGQALTSWDRGFNAAGEQVWGAVDGPYVFVKQ